MLFWLSGVLDNVVDFDGFESDVLELAPLGCDILEDDPGYEGYEG